MVFKDYKLNMKNTALHVENSTSEMLDLDNENISFRKLLK